MEESDIQRQQSIDIKKQDASIAIAQKSEEKSVAEAAAAKTSSQKVLQCQSNQKTGRKTQ